jgi:16S rRNA (guanine527-N7)-methyltransferase
MLAEMDTGRISELLKPFLGGEQLSEIRISLISAYLDLLMKWNARMNLTAVRDPEQIVQRHFGESLFAARQLQLWRPDATSLADLGSGAGFPGLPIKMWDPKLNLTLIESHEKKATFLREAVRTLEMTDAQVLNARAQSVSIRADIVTLRAVEAFDQTLPVAAGLLNDHGALLLLIGSAQVSKAVSRLPELSWTEPEPIPLSDNRVILRGTRKP